MANGPIRRKTEVAVRDRSGNPVGLLYDETNDKTVMQRGSSDGAGKTIGTSVVCTECSTTTALGIDEKFTGTAVDINGYATILLSIYSDVASATDGLVISFSHDGVDFHEADSYTYVAGSYKTYSFQPVDQYLRVEYTNGGVAQTDFHISTRLHSSNVKASSHRMADDIKGQDDAELVKAVLAAEKAGSVDDLYTNIQATAGGNLKVSVEEMESGVILPQSQTYAYNGTSWQPARSDLATRSLQFIDYGHHEIHSGSHYFVDGYVDLAINHVLDFTWQMPDTTKWIHWLWELNVESETLYQVYEGAVATNALANTYTPYNNNRNSVNTSDTIMKYEDQATLAAANADTDVSGATLLKSGIIGTGKGKGGSASRDDELILKQDTLYCLRATANAAGWITFRMAWYEHTDKAAS